MGEPEAIGAVLDADTRISRILGIVPFDGPADMVHMISCRQPAGWFRTVYEVPVGEPLTIQGEDGQHRTNPQRRVVRWEYRCPSCPEDRCWHDEKERVNGCDGAWTSSGKHVCPGCHAEYLRRRESGELTPEGPHVDVNVPSDFDQAELARVVRLRGKAEVCAEPILKGWPDKMPFLLIKGVTGSGKTYATWALVRAMLRTNRRVAWYNATDLRKRWLGAREHGSGDSLEERLQQTPWLILDALDEAGATDGWIELVLRLLNARLDHERPLVVTLAVGGDEIERTYGAQVRSRLRRLVIVEMPERDRREAKA